MPKNAEQPPQTAEQQIGNEVVKKKNELWRKSPIAGDNRELFESKEEKKMFVKRTIGNILKYYGIERVKSDEEANERIIQYFEDCIETGRRPLWEELCLALGTTRNDMWQMEHRYKSPVVKKETIERAREYIATYDAAAASEGKINPVLYFFRAKNYYGMKDQQDVVITPNTPLGAETDAKQLESKYAESVIDTTGTEVEEE